MGVFSRVYNSPESIGDESSSKLRCEHGPVLAEFWVHKCQFVQLSARVHGHEHRNSKVNDRKRGEQFFSVRCLRPRFTGSLAGRPGRLIPGCIWSNFQRNFFSRHQHPVHPICPRCEHDFRVGDWFCTTPNQLTGSDTDAHDGGVTAWRYGWDSLHNDVAGEWRDDAVQLECKFGNAAGRVESRGIDWGDLRDADNGGDIQLHGQGNGFDCTDPANGGAVVQHHGCGSRHSGANHDQFDSIRAGRDGLYDDHGGEWRDDAVQLEHQFGGVASRSNAGSGERDDLGNADNSGIIQLHGEGNGLDSTDSANGDEVVQHNSCGSGHSGANHDQFGSFWAGRDGLYDNIGGEWRDDAVQLEHQFGGVASRSNAGSGERDDLGNAHNSGIIQLHGEGNGLDSTDSANGDEVVQHNSCGSGHSGANHDQSGSIRAGRDGLYDNIGGEWRDDAVQLEHQFGGVASRSNAGSGERDDLGNAHNSGIIQLHGEGNGLDSTDSANGDEVVQHNSCGSGHSGANHDQFGCSRTSRRSLFDDDRGQWWDDAVQLEHQLGSGASRSNAGCGERDDLGNAHNGGIIQLHGEGNGFDRTNSADSDEIVHPHDCGSGRSGANHDQFGSFWAGRDGLYEDIGGKWRDDTL